LLLDSGLIRRAELLVEGDAVALGEFTCRLTRALAIEDVLDIVKNTVAAAGGTAICLRLCVHHSVDDFSQFDRGRVFRPLDVLNR
jgi:hypothetical protein